MHSANQLACLMHPQHTHTQLPPGCPCCTPTQVVTQPKQLLQDIKTAAITNGNSVKDQVDTTVSTFRGSTAGIKSMVVTQLNDIRDQYQEPAKLYDGYRLALAGVGLPACPDVFAGRAGSG
jgi:hypothetical protein